MGDGVGIEYDTARAAAYDEAHGSATALADAEAAAEQVAALADGGPVLELGVGTGRLALPLVRRGVDVTGIDRSEAMLARLRQKPEGERVVVIRGDFAEAGALVDGPFAVVLLATSTLFELTTQDEQVRCVQGAAALLGAGGRLVIEAFAPDVTRLEQTLHVREIGPGHVVLQAVRHDPIAQVVSGHDVTISSGETRLSPLSIRYVTVAELDLMARLAGLRLRDRWGGWRGEPFVVASTAHVTVYDRGTAGGEG